jgi:hypothetical protein
VVDYGRIEIAGDSMDIARAVLLALCDFRDEIIEKGFAVEGSDERRIPEQVWIDARYKDQGVYPFILENGPRYKAALGFGIGPQYGATGAYYRPAATGKKAGRHVRFIGEDYHISWFAEKGAWVVEVNADGWKSWGHRRLATPVLDADGNPQPGAITFYSSTDRNEHLSLVKMLTSEKQVEEFVKGMGLVKKWVRVSKKNHHLDNFYNCCTIGNFVGVRLIKPLPPPPPVRTVTAKEPAPSRFARDGVPFMATERK